ncbi:MAG: PQQ-like beta-propeller repeat protein [Streptosporangiales bacterium]|nr:PQQ-like beta-propeller repeat protein [Streptosporangiales bacterium]
MTHRTVRGAALLATVLAAGGCTTAQRPGLWPQGTPRPHCTVNARSSWAVRLTFSGHVLWQAPVRGWKNHAVAPVTSSAVSPVSPVAAGDEAAVPDGDAVTGLRAADGHALWRWTGTDWVTGLWQWHGTIAVLTGTGQNARLTGLRAATGAVAWQRPVPGTTAGNPDQDDQAETADGALAVTESTSSTGADGAPATSSTLQVVNLADGTLRWHRSASGPVAAAGGTVIATGPLTGYDDRTGAVRWTAASGSRNGPQALSLLPLNGQSVASWLDATYPAPTVLQVFDARTGRLTGQFKSSRAVAERAPLPTGRNVITFQAPDPHNRGSVTDTVPGLTLVSTALATGATRWTRSVPSNATGPLTLAGTEVVTGTSHAQDMHDALRQFPGVLLAYDAATGRPLWRAVLPADTEAAPAPADGGIVAQAGYDTQICAMAP